jgi:hypothetical protein
MQTNHGGGGEYTTPCPWKKSEWDLGQGAIVKMYAIPFLDFFAGFSAFLRILVIRISMLVWIFQNSFEQSSVLECALSSKNN